MIGYNERFGTQKCIHKIMPGTSSSVTGQLLIHEGFWILKCPFLKSGHLGTRFFKATIQVWSRRSFCRSIKWSHEFIKSQKWFLENWEINGGFLKWWYPTTIGFPTANDHFGVFWWYHHLSKHPNGSIDLICFTDSKWYWCQYCLEYGMHNLQGYRRYIYI